MKTDLTSFSKINFSKCSCQAPFCFKISANLKGTPPSQIPSATKVNEMYQEGNRCTKNDPFDLMI